MSGKLTPAAPTRTTTSRGPGSGVGTSLTCRTDGSPRRSRTTARMGSLPSFDATLEACVHHRPQGRHDQGRHAILADADKQRPTESDREETQHRGSLNERRKKGESQGRRGKCDQQGPDQQPKDPGKETADGRGPCG